MMKVKRIKDVRRVTEYYIYTEDNGERNLIPVGKCVSIKYKDGSEVCGSIYEILNNVLELETGEETIEIWYEDIDTIEEIKL